MLYRIEVRPKPNVNDARRATIANDIRALGIVADVIGTVADLYLIEGKLTDDDVQRVCEELLCDAVVQDYQIDDGRRTTDDQKSAIGHRPSAIVEVSFKPGVTDATADEIVRAAHELGIAGLQRAATGTAYMLDGKLSGADVQLSPNACCAMMSFRPSRTMRQYSRSITQLRIYSITQ